MKKTPLSEMDKELLDVAWCLWACRTICNVRTQKQLCGKLGISQKHLSRILRNHEPPSIELLNRWAGLYKMKIKVKIGV